MSSDYLKENMVKKIKYMKGRYSLFKYSVYMYIQYMSFQKEVRDRLRAVESIFGNKERRIIIIKDIFRYLYSTTDIWTSIDTFSKTVRAKLISLAEEEPIIFNVYLARFGYICPYPKRHKEICGIKVNGTLCRIHIKCEERLKNRILDSIPSKLSSDVSNIVFEYAVPYSRDN